MNVERISVMGDPNDMSPTGHGTCVASIACSNIGIMIKGTLVSVKSHNRERDLTAARVWRAFGMAILDIVAKERQGRSVINMSLGSKSIIYKMTFVHTNLLYSSGSINGNNNFDEITKLQYQKLVQDAEAKGIVIVVTAGNQVGTVILTRLSTLCELTI
jgi:hypothetical protein